MNYHKENVRKLTLGTVSGSVQNTAADAAT